MLLVVIGPRITRPGATSQSLDRALAHQGVRWLGYRAPADLPAYLQAASVGITPYVLNDFNRASLPLKSLEYLAAGLPVVSTDLPSVHELGCPHIRVADGVESFVSAVRRELASTRSAAEVTERRAFAVQNSLVGPRRPGERVEFATIPPVRCASSRHGARSGSRHAGSPSEPPTSPRS